MQCKNPYFEPRFGILCPCRQCLPCRINRRKEWTVRAILEASSYENISFLTLTYDDEHLPLNGSLVSSDLTKFWKRLRKFGLKFRYFACGEYGEKSYRPHYHAIIYGVDSVTLQYFASECWKFGFIYSVPATVETIKYVAGYVTKKLAVRKDMQEMGMTSEFVRSSRGLGRESLEKLSAVVFVQGSHDVVNRIKIGGQDFVIPRYLKEKLREKHLSNLHRSNLKEARIELMQEDIINLCWKWFKNRDYDKSLAVRSHLLENEQHFRNIYSKDKIWNLRSKV